MIEQIINPWNLRQALDRVIRNKGAAGVDGMGVSSLYGYYRENREKIVSSLRDGYYLPRPVKGISIPKGNGKTRLLGVPTVVDRLLQQAVGQVLLNHYDMEFEDYSYGFRPNRNAHQAVRQSLNSGKTHYKITINHHIKISKKYQLNV